MVKFGLACEGITDHIVIENILCGFYKDYDDLDEEIQAFQPAYDETTKKQKEQERKARSHKLIVLGSALLKKSETDNDTKQLIKSLINDKFIDEKYANLFEDDIILVRQSLIHDLP